MSDSEKPDPWKALAEALGTTPPPPSQPATPAPAVVPPPPRKPADAAPKSKPAPGWSQLAAELGIEAAPVPQPPPAPATGDVSAAPAHPRGGQDRPDRRHRPQPPYHEPPQHPRSEAAVSKGLDEPEIVTDVEVVGRDESRPASQEGEGERRGRRRRRRRGRGRRPDGQRDASDRLSAPEEAAGDDLGPPREFDYDLGEEPVPGAAEAEVSRAEGEVRPVGDEEEPRRRRRRRRGRRGRKRDGEDRGTEPRPDRPAAVPGPRLAEDELPEADEPLFDDEEDLDEDLLRADTRQHGHAVSDNGAEVDDDGDDDGELKHGHKGIPTWEEAIGLIVAGNLEARAKNPHSGGPPRRRGRGGRGRGRG